MMYTVIASAKKAGARREKPELDTLRHNVPLS